MLSISHALTLYYPLYLPLLLPLALPFPGLDDFSRESAVEESSSAADGARDDNDEEAIPNLPSATEDRPLPRPPRGPGSVKRSAAEVKTELLREARTQKLTPLEKQCV